MNLNNPNKKIEFNIDFGDTFCSSKFQYFISGSLTKAEGGDYAAGSNIKLTVNFVPFLFSRIEAKKHYKLIDEIEYPGIILQPETIAQRNSDFESIYGRHGKFFVSGGLSNFGLNFFEDVNIPIYKGDFTLSFTTQGMMNIIFKLTENNELNFLSKAGKITLNEIIIRVPIPTRF